MEGMLREDTLKGKTYIITGGEVSHLDAMWDQFEETHKKS